MAKCDASNCVRIPKILILIRAGVPLPVRRVRPPPTRSAEPVIDGSRLAREYTLGAKARIALDLKRYDIVESVLKEIMQLKMDPDIPDIGRERNFFDRLPPGSIDAEVARQYNEFCLAVGRGPPKK